MNSFIAARKKNRRNSLRIDNFNFGIKPDQEEPVKNRFKEIYSEQSELQSELRSIEPDNYSEKNDYTPSYASTEVTEYASHNSDLSCSLCRIDNKNPLIILSCSHIFHINCLGEAHAQNKTGVVDKEFLLSQKCNICHKQIDLEDISHIHNKYLKSLKTSIEEKETDILLLNKKLNVIKEDLRIFYELKQKLESQRDTSKQISMIVSTLL